MKKMNEIKVSVVPCSANPIIFDETKCIGCNTCARTCHCDVLLPSTKKGQHPIVAWPGECWYCGACVLQCPVEGAIHLEHPLMNRTKFVDAIPEPKDAE
ncbi:MAG: 4Fe-4S dicluster domain-containing protein [Eubacteriales bacterium]|nr:4Fe-4S dicluster domain-containing protein [Eubacteriales bacterium]